MLDALNGAASELFAATLSLVVIYLAALARSYVKKATDKLDSDMDSDARARLEAALENAIDSAEAAGQSITLDHVTEYLKTFNAGDLKRFGLEGDKLDARATAAIESVRPKPRHPEGM